MISKRRKEPKSGTDALHDVERKVLDLWDDGKSLDEIATALPDVRPSRSQKIIRNLGCTIDSHQQAVRAASIALGRRINEVHGMGRQ